METLIYIMEPLDSSNNLDLSVDKRMPKIIFKIKKYCVIYIWNRKSIDFNMTEIVAKNILAYRIFNKNNWDQKAKKCGYRYFNQVLENWKEEIQTE